MYVHSRNTSAVLNELGFYVLSKIHKWPHMRAFKNIPKFYTTSPDVPTDFWPEIKGANGGQVFPARPLITGGLLAYLGSLFTTACHFRVGDTRLGGIAELCYDRHAKRFGAYDSDTLQPFLSRRLTAWCKQFPVTGAVAGASDSDEGEGEVGRDARDASVRGTEIDDEAPPIDDE
jgi:hypothetical protein